MPPPFASERIPATPAARQGKTKNMADGALLESFQDSMHKDFHQYLRTHWNYYRRDTRWPDALFWKRRTTPITLDPMMAIAHASPDTTQTSAAATHLSARLVQRLQHSCQSGQPAHQVVREFSRANPQISDQRIILGLQELVEAGKVTLRHSETA